MIGTVKSSTVDTNSDGENNVRILEVEISDPDDIQTVENYGPGGYDFSPPAGTRVQISREGEAWKISHAMDDGIEPDSDEGEVKIYSVDSGARGALIVLRADGTIELNGDTDFITKFNEMKTAFDQFKSDFDGHKHYPSGTLLDGLGSPCTGDTGVPSSAPGVPKPTTADMANAKADTVKV